MQSSSLSKPSKSKEEGKEETPFIDGVKEDLSHLAKTITCQLWAVASLIAPSPAVGPTYSLILTGIHNDFEDNGSSFKMRISRLASSFLWFRPGDEADDCDGVGITSAAFNFARDVSKRAESWLNFPLPFDDDNVRDPTEVFCTISLLQHQQQRQISTNTQLQSSKDDCSFLDMNSISSSIQEHYGSVHVKQVSVNTVNAKELYNIMKWLGENGKVDTSINDRKQLSNGENVSFGHLDDDDENGFIRHDCSRSLQDAWVSSSDVISSQYVELSQDSDDAHGTRRNNKSQPTSQGRNLEDSDLSDWLLIDDIDFWHQ